MALTNRMLKTMGIEEEQRDQIMEAHQDTLREIREERDRLRDQAAKVPDLQRQLQEAQEAAEANAGDEWREKFEAEHRALEDYRQKVEAKEQERSKARAYRDMLVNKAKVDPKRVWTRTARSGTLTRPPRLRLRSGPTSWSPRGPRAATPRTRPPTVAARAPRGSATSPPE